MNYLESRKFARITTGSAERERCGLMKSIR